jgi:HEPN domain-containing protein
VRILTANEKYEYWLEIAQYDLDTADAMFAGSRWLYVVFMCQQAIEKLVKGLYTFYLDDIPPRTHNIVWLAGKLGVKLPAPVSDEYNALFAALTKYYIGDRYPDFIRKLGASIDNAEAERVLKKSKEVFAWLQTMKP